MPPKASPCPPPPPPAMLPIANTIFPGRAERPRRLHNLQEREYGDSHRSKPRAMHPDGQGTVRLRFLDLYNRRPLRSTLSWPSINKLWPPPSDAHLRGLLRRRFRDHNVERNNQCIRNRAPATWHWRRCECRRRPNLYLGSSSSHRPRDLWVPHSDRDEHGHPHNSDPRVFL